MLHIHAVMTYQVYSFVERFVQKKTYNGHFCIPKFIPKVLNGVYTDESSHKKTNHFHTENSQHRGEREQEEKLVKTLLHSL